MSTAQAPIRIGYCLSLTGPLAGNSRSAQLAHDIWREDVNRRGGLLGRPVELVCYDDRADASHVPDLYEQLMDEDTRRRYAAGRCERTLSPQHRRRTLVARDRVGASEHFLERLYADPILPHGENALLDIRSRHDPFHECTIGPLRAQPKLCR